MATLKDVAKASGLTVGTVSRVLNNRGYISDKTREKVYQVMKELNYQPNEMARSLSKQKNNTIGIILPQYSTLMEKLQEILGIFYRLQTMQYSLQELQHPTAKYAVSPCK